MHSFNSSSISTPVLFGHRGTVVFSGTWALLGCRAERVSLHTPLMLPVCPLPVRRCHPTAGWESAWVGWCWQCLQSWLCAAESVLFRWWCPRWPGSLPALPWMTVDECIILLNHGVNPLFVSVWLFTVIFIFLVWVSYLQSVKQLMNHQ